MATHKVYLVPRKAEGGGAEIYEVQDECGATIVGTAREPMGAAADAYLAMGASPTDMLEAWRKGDTFYSIRGSLGYWSKAHTKAVKRVRAGEEAVSG
jgi:hypothetical protein